LAFVALHTRFTPTFHREQHASSKAQKPNLLAVSEQESATEISDGMHAHQGVNVLVNMVINAYISPHMKAK